MRTSDDKKRIKVIIADDQVLFASSLKLVLESDTTGDFAVIGVARDGMECVELLRALIPDVILMDLRMPNMDGVEATRPADAAGGRRARKGARMAMGR